MIEERRPGRPGWWPFGGAGAVSAKAAAVTVLGVVVSGLAGCGGRAPALEELVEGDDCRRTVMIGPPAERLEALESDSARAAAAAEHRVEWRLPSESTEVARLNAWCAAVGPAVVGGWSDTAATRAVLDTLWLVTWNVHVGGGDIRRLMADLRAGRLTDGTPVEHFVLLLQETHREGDLVPAREAGEPSGSGVDAAPPEGPREDVVATAERLGLWVLYAPSMRNGEHEDRGNAVLSTLPLDGPVAVGLPVARQRRVAVSADVAGRTRDGRDWRLQVTSVHLESSPSGWTSDEAARLEQAEALIALLPEAEAAVAGGDFNTKTRGREEALVRVLEEAYPDTPPFPEGPTYRKVFGFYREYLDFLFFRLPDETGAWYERVPRPYNSDHYPLVGWVAW